MPKPVGKKAVTRATASEPLPVYLVVTPGVLLLDLAGIAEPLRLANKFAQQNGAAHAPFDLRVCSADGEAVRSSLPLMLSGLSPLPAKLPRRAWVVLSGTVGKPVTATSTVRAHSTAVAQWLRAVVAPALDGVHDSPHGVRLWTVCSGALIAARAGLLDGRNCTTHHELIDELTMLSPSARVQANRIFVQDGPVATSAGITAGIDLALHAVQQHCGPAVAAQVARDMVVYWRRAGGDPQLSPVLAWRNHLHPAVHRAQDAVLARPAAHWSLATLAEAAHVSTRHLRRLFADNTGVSPLVYVQSVRVALARQHLQGGRVSVEQAATMAGFTSAQQLRYAWRRSESDLPQAARMAAR
jgi:transcriptional regulator GlxA family with amidase domain